jgi:acyl-CoA dehydrogenase
VTELAIPPGVDERRAEVRAFMEEHVYPNESALAREDEAADALIEELRAKAKAAGIWAPHLPPEAGGTGSGFIEYALLNEEIGRSMWAQLVFNCQAPDAGPRSRRSASSGRSSRGRRARSSP